MNSDLEKPRMPSPGSVSALAIGCTCPFMDQCPVHPVKCDRCGGEGKLFRMVSTPMEVKTYSARCPACNGTGTK